MSTTLTFSFPSMKMASKQQQLRARVVQFYQKNQLRGKCFTIQHFMDEGVPHRTSYHILRQYEERGGYDRKSGTGRKAVIMTKKTVKRLKKKLESLKPSSTRALAIGLGCSQQHVWKTIHEKTSLVCKKKRKAPFYTPEAEKMCKSACRRLYALSAGKDFIIDDEKYFSLTGAHMPGNSFYWCNNRDRGDITPHQHQVKSKQKFEPKLMLWMALSPAGIAKPYVVPSGLAVNKEVYIKECLQSRLLPFIRDNHPPTSYLFWPDKASSHYAKATQEFLTANNVPFVPRGDNPTNLPQCRPIEDLFGQLSQEVYKNGWAAKNVNELKKRVLYCIRKTDFSAVQAKCVQIRHDLRACYTHSPYKCIH
jgi:hypothetical protein